MTEEISPISHLEKVIAGQESPISHLEKVIAQYGGSGLLKSIQSLEYEGENITCENTLVSRTSDVLIKGQTYQNLVNSFNAGPGCTIDDFINISGTGDVVWTLCDIKVKPQLSSNKIYTVIYNCINTSGNFEFAGFDSNRKWQLGSGVKKTGINKFLISNKDVLTLRIQTNENDASIKIDKNIIILEGDWTNKEVPASITGIESAGEKENKISILSYNKNLVNPNKLFLNNSSIIKENGAFICPPNVSWQTEKIMGVDLSKPLYFAYEIKSDENIIIDTTNQNLLIRLDYVKTGGNVIETNIPIGTKITNEYTKVIFKNISLSNNLGEQGINLVFRNGVGKKMYIRNITISNTPIDDVIPYQQDKKEILLPFEGGLKSLPNGVCDTIEQRNDGVYLVRRVGKVILANLNYSISFNNDIGLIVRALLSDIASLTDINYLSNLNIGNSSAWKFDDWYGKFPIAINTGNMQANNQQGIEILVQKRNITSITDLASFKKYLQDNSAVLYYELNTPVETKLDINNLDLEVYKDITYVTTENAIQPVLSFKVPSNIGGMIQVNAQNINKLYKLIDEVIIPQLINNSADIEILKLK